VRGGLAEIEHAGVALSRARETVSVLPLATTLKASGYALFDVQVQNRHLESLGCIEIPRREYLARLAEARELAPRLGSPERPSDR
jgi:leucyl/phenylalanyl-tRNA--protein transferase